MGNPAIATVAVSLRDAIAALTGAGIDTPRLDAQLLIAHALKLRREDLIAYPDRALSSPDQAAIGDLVARRQQRYPLAYLLGEQWFYGRAFSVTPAVLIPRPETEMLVEFAVAHAPCGGSVADIGTGSGCIAVSIAAERTDLAVLAVDLSPDALAVAASNAVRHNVADRVSLALGDLLAPLVGRFDVIVSNPPYIAASEMPGLMPEVRDYEPSMALCEGAGDDGLAIYRRLWEGAVRYLVVGGWLAVEVGQGQAMAVAAMAREAGFANVQISSDGAGIERMVAGQIT